ncbi:MAG: membrane protein insertase YidC [Proteobacteria bacterium]|nr:membrane protein insertase YidC [Pseudomonadota bacterium]
MNNPKNMLLIALFFLGFMLYIEWQKDYGPKPVAPVDGSQITQTIQTQQNLDSSIPEQANTAIPTAADVPKVANQVPTQSQAQKQVRVTGALITITTNVLKLKIDTIGGSIVYAELLQYPIKKYATQNVVLLNQQPEEIYIAQSGLVSAQQSFVHTDIYTAEQNNYAISSGTIDVPLSIEKNGITLTKTYKISADSYLIELLDDVNNQTNVAWQGQQYKQIQRTNSWLHKESSFTDTDRMSFKGASYFLPEEGYVQLDFEDFVEDKINISVKNEGWIAMDQHYFFSSFIFNDEKTDIISNYLPNSPTPYLIRATSSFATAAVNSSTQFSTKFYVGPKLQAELPKIATGLGLTVDYGIFSALAKPLFWVLNKIHSVVGNWGWSIILLTILIKLLFFKLTEKQYNSMARMRKLSPRIKTLKERHKDNKQKFNEEMMNLYKKEKVNPMGGCLPMLVQIPVFIALYWVLMESVELRQAPFMLWLQDLSTPDPYFILPAINAAAMYMTQKLSPTPGMDPMQAKIMKFMPIGFSVMFAFFQSGLVLYWAVNSSLSLLQQWIITKKIDAAN